MPTSPSHIVFFGHHKCGSRFFRQTVLRPLAQANGYETQAYHINEPMFEFETAHDLDLYHVDFEKFAASERAVLMLANSGKPVVDRLNRLGLDYVGIHVLRDPRQFFVSSYFHHLDGHIIVRPDQWIWRKLEKDRPILESLSLEDGLLYELDNITKDVIDNQLRPWRPAPNILEIRLEEFNPDPLTGQQNLAHLAEFCGFTDRAEIDLSKTFSNPAAPSDWRRVLTTKVLEAFNERYGDLVAQLGYDLSLTPTDS
ncbi:MAG: hypothetical protein AAFR21_09365 [Pseudomonadota bacterium]